MKTNKLPIYKEGDFIPYINITINRDNLTKFSNIKYVILQGSADRTAIFANDLLVKLLNFEPNLYTLYNLFGGFSYVAYKVGNVLLVSHGMGNSSILTLLHTLTPLLQMCNHEFSYIRIGTSGGIGVDAGTVILTQNSYTADIINGYAVYKNNQKTIYSTKMNDRLNQDIINNWYKSKISNEIKLIEKNTMCADDFYLSQARMDGVVHLDFDKTARINYLQTLKDNHIGNIEMESGALGYFANLYNISATTISTTIINRLETDQVSISSKLVHDYSLCGQIIIANYLKECQ